jgi:PAS domain S-box-containing protein
MSNRVSTLSTILRSPIRILATVLLLVFTVEVCVMLVLPHVVPKVFGDAEKALFDAVLLTVVCAPVLWWVIIGPLRRIAIQEHQRSETIVASASEGILTFDMTGTILSCNRAATELFSRSIEELVGCVAPKLLDGFSPQFDSLPSTFRSHVNRTDGSGVSVEVSVSEYPSQSKRLCIAIIRDLTISDQAEAQKVEMARETEALRTQQMTTLAQLATGVAHEIRNPLTSIKMLIQVNRDRLSREGLPTEDLELVENEIRRMERSVTSLLDYARPEVAECVVFPIQTVIRRVVQLLQGQCEGQDVKVIADCADDPLCILGDTSQIQQLLLNLSLNALDAMPSGGELVIRASGRGGNVELTVIDSGPGIRVDMIDKLFVPFSTSKATGVGLGLGICRRIADSHNGTLVARNLGSGGAEFLLTLPLACSEGQASSVQSTCEGPCKVF